MKEYDPKHCGGCKKSCRYCNDVFSVVIPATKKGFMVRAEGAKESFREYSQQHALEQLAGMAVPS